MTADPALSPADHALVYGHDPTERIVALHPVGSDRMRVYVRPAHGPVTWTDEPVHPFFWLTDVELLARGVAGARRGFPRERFRFQALDGPGAYRHLVVVPDRGAYFDAIRHVAAAAETQRERPDDIYTPGSPEQQYLMQTGRTLFKGMELDDLVRLQLDIEVYSRDGFPDASVAEHRIILVALSDSTGWTQLVGAPGMDEAELLRETVRLVRERDPDVIEMHNGFGFDLPYLAARCRRHGVPLALGRDGSEPRSFPSSIRFAERQLEYDAAEVAGRHVVDTMFLAMAYDVFRRDLPNYTLKGVARYFGFAPEGRTYVPGDQIAHVWDTEPERLMAYALDDAVETERIARHLSGSHFYLAQMVPMPYGTAARTGPAAKIEALFVRGYLHARRALPRPQVGSQVVGGYTDVFVTGVVGPVVYADVESLYPSIMLAYGIGPESDTLGLHPRLLRVLTDLRLATKAAMRDADDAARGELDARQSAIKIIINSFYGNMGFGFALFNDFAQADRVAATGQDLVRRMVAHVREAGGTVVEVDTDGVLFVPPPDVSGEAAERAFVASMTAVMPDGIRIGFDGRFPKMLSFKKKNYALRTDDGHVKLKGSSLVSRSMERFGRRFVREAIRRLLDEDIAGLHALYLDTRRAVVAHEWAEGAADFQRVETLKDSLDRYADDVAEGRRNRSAAYEIAAAQAAEGAVVRRGHRVAWYMATGGGTRAFESARSAEAWDPAAPDEDTAFYLDRLDQFAAKFEPFFETPAMHRAVFSEEDLFGFDASGIRLAVRARDPSEVEDEVPF